jgi:hypothetical protein
MSLSVWGIIPLHPDKTNGIRQEKKRPKKVLLPFFTLFSVVIIIPFDFIYLTISIEPMPIKDKYVTLCYDFTSQDPFY